MPYSCSVGRVQLTCRLTQCCERTERVVKKGVTYGLGASRSYSKCPIVTYAILMAQKESSPPLVTTGPPTLDCPPVPSPPAIAPRTMDHGLVTNPPLVDRLTIDPSAGPSQPPLPSTSSIPPAVQEEGASAPGIQAKSTTQSLPVPSVVMGSFNQSDTENLEEVQDQLDDDILEDAWGLLCPEQEAERLETREEYREMLEAMGSEHEQDPIPDLAVRNEQIGHQDL
uniref:Uncharacterized protein n=1 Tax=Knipowitschia caucasica TaxID=637954 RepID=A0AAV2J808_KNICA